MANKQQDKFTNQNVNSEVTMVTADDWLNDEDDIANAQLKEQLDAQMIATSAAPTNTNSSSKFRSYPPRRGGNKYRYNKRGSGYRARGSRGRGNRYNNKYRGSRNNRYRGNNYRGRGGRGRGRAGYPKSGVYTADDYYAQRQQEYNTNRKFENIMNAAPYSTAHTNMNTYNTSQSPAYYQNNVNNFIPNQNQFFTPKYQQQIQTQPTVTVMNQPYHTANNNNLESVVYAEYTQNNNNNNNNSIAPISTTTNHRDDATLYGASTLGSNHNFTITPITYNNNVLNAAQQQQPIADVSAGVANMTFNDTQNEPPSFPKPQFIKKASSKKRKNEERTSWRTSQYVQSDKMSMSKKKKVRSYILNRMRHPAFLGSDHELNEQIIRELVNEALKNHEHIFGDLLNQIEQCTQQQSKQEIICDIADLVSTEYKYKTAELRQNIISDELGSIIYSATKQFYEAHVENNNKRLQPNKRQNGGGILKEIQLQNGGRLRA